MNLWALNYDDTIWQSIQCVTAFSLKKQNDNVCTELTIILMLSKRYYYEQMSKYMTKIQI